MILLLGGTSETAPLAAAFAAQGWPVLISTATDVPLILPEHPLLERRSGRLAHPGMMDLISQRDICLVVDATHPFATEAHATARAAAKEAGIPCLRWQRLRLSVSSAAATEAADHDEAARLAMACGLPVLLTTGSRHLSPYVQAAAVAGIPLFARVLPHAESEEACRMAGLPPANVIAARGPFSVHDTVDLINRFAIGVLVTKDSGGAGGLPEKLEAARITGCQVVIIRQPAQDAPNCYETIDDLLAAIHALLATRTV